MSRILTSALVIALLALSAGAKIIDMEGRTATLVGRTQYKAKKIGRTKILSNVIIDFETRTWMGTMDEEALDLSGTFQFVGKGGRQIDVAYDAPSFDAVEEYFGEQTGDLRFVKKGVDRELTADISHYKLIFKISNNRKKAKLKGKFKIVYTDPVTEDTHKGKVKIRMKGVVSRAEE